MKTIIQTDQNGRLLRAVGTCTTKEVKAELFQAHQTVREVKK